MDTEQDCIKAFEDDYVIRYGHKPPQALNHKDPVTGEWVPSQERYCNTALWRFQGWKAAWEIGNPHPQEKIDVKAESGQAGHWQRHLFDAQGHVL